MKLLFPLAPAAALAVRAQTPAARIKIDSDRTAGEVHPHLFSSSAGHLGRCVYGGICEPGSPPADSDGFRKDVPEAVKGLSVTLLRWPGAILPPAATGRTASDRAACGPSGRHSPSSGGRGGLNGYRHRVRDQRVA